MANQVMDKGVFPNLSMTALSDWITIWGKVVPPSEGVLETTLAS
jgi:hypothetical protein